MFKRLQITIRKTNYQNFQILRTKQCFKAYNKVDNLEMKNQSFYQTKADKWFQKVKLTV